MILLLLCGTTSTNYVLQIAVDNGFGGAFGQQKAEWMNDVVGKYFYENCK